MANHELPQNIFQDLEGIVLDPQAPRFITPQEHFGPKDGTPPQIKVYKETRQELLPYEITLHSRISECLEHAKRRRFRDVYDSTIETNSGDIKGIVIGVEKGKNNQTVCKFLIFIRNRIDFNRKEQISRVEIGPYDAQSGSYVNLSSPRNMVYHDNLKPSVKNFPVDKAGQFLGGNFPLHTSSLVKVAVGQILPSSLL